MTEPILDINYWKRRLEGTRFTYPHHAIFRCPLEVWQNIEEKHVQILKQHIEPTNKILDVGCAWGRLLSMLPDSWVGDYLGIDLSPDFLHRARLMYPARDFLQGDMRNLSFVEPYGTDFDWAIMISIKPMIERNLGKEVWDAIEFQLRKYAKRLLFLEYDAADPGRVVEWA